MAASQTPVAVPVVRVESTRTALAEVAAAWHDRPASALRSSASLARERVEPTSHATPEPLALLGHLARLAGSGCDVVAIVASSHALVQQRLHGLAFDLAIFTNQLPPEHSDFHASLREYVAAKRPFL